MLVIDDKMFKLAKMQETLLKVSPSSKQENLINYKKTVTEIDNKAFDDILEEIKHINEHNHSLENEVQFLEEIESAYNQLEELQARFKSVCELHGDNDLELSDLSRLNIGYIRDRISAINGYLINLKNIDKNKKELQKLSEQLVDEEKKKMFLDKKLLELETALRNNFCDAEGRFVQDGKLQYASVISEYNKLGFDFKDLLTDVSTLDEKLSELEIEKTDVSEKVRVAEVCYNNILNTESKQILDEINRDYLFIKYKLVMLKILKLLSQDYSNYDLVKEKREDLLDLIKYRLSCMEALGIKVSIDPFNRAKVSEQLDTILSLTDNSKTIKLISKKISDLNLRIEQMLGENNKYLESLSDTRDLIENNGSVNHIDTTSVSFAFEDMLMKKEITPNQVVAVRDVSNGLNMNIIMQKTTSVMSRVNKMMNGPSQKKEELKEQLIPELVIVPASIDDYKQETILETDAKTDEEHLQEKVENEIQPDLQILPIVEPKETLVVDTSDIFETVVPFNEPSLFMDRTDEIVSQIPVSVSDSLTSEELKGIANREDSNLELTYSDHEEKMPDAFWVTQSEEDKNDDYAIPSFDDQIKMLLSKEENNTQDAKTRKKVA